MKKRFLSVVLVLCVLLSAMPMAQAASTSEVSVIDAFSGTYTTEYGTCSWHIPKIVLTNADASEVNAEIWDDLYVGYYQADGGDSWDVSYDYYVNGDVLSVVVCCEYVEWDWTDYFVYNVSTSTGKTVSDDQVIQAAGYTSDEIPQLVVQSIYDYMYWQLTNDALKNHNPSPLAQYKLSITESNVAKAVPYINGEGDLCAVVYVYSIAGADGYYHLLNLTEAAGVPPFLDVVSGSWFYDTIAQVYRMGLMNGVDTVTFDPDGTLTRAMLVTILWRLEGAPTASASSFTDLEQDWYKTAVNWAAGVEIVNGYDQKTFGPEDTITREQLVTILYRYANYKGYSTTAADSLSGYSDAASLNSWAMAAMRWAVGSEIVNGVTTTTLEPEGSATRAQAATMLLRFINNIAS